MKRILMTIVVAAVSLNFMSCIGGPESKGNKAYDMAQKTSGDERRMYEKEAYMNYKKAITEKGDKVKAQLRQRFLEMAIIRSNLILHDGGLGYEAIPLLEEEIEKNWSPDLPDKIKNDYADYLVLIADSSLEKSKINAGLTKLDQAIEVSADKGKFEQAKKDRMKGLVERYYATADFNYKQGKDNKDAEDLVRAEFYAKMVLFFDSTHADAKALLSKARKANVSTYSVYKKVIDPPPDTAIFDKINKYDIMLAVSAQSRRGKNLVMKVTMWNYSYNPQRLKARSFSLVDSKGRKYVASKSSKISPEFLDLEHETELTLVFPRPSGAIKKLVYDWKPHYAEKVFY